MKAWDILVEDGVPRGLHLSQEKSLVYCPEHDPQDLDPLSRGVTRVEKKGIKLLGAPVGEVQYEEEILEKRLISIQTLLDSLHTLDDPHLEYTLLRSCFSFPKFGYSLRTVDTSSHPSILQKFDSSVMEAMGGILGAPLPPAKQSQASLPVTLGGLGLRSAATHGPGAYLASLGVQLPSCKRSGGRKRPHRLRRQGRHYRT